MPRGDGSGRTIGWWASSALPGAIGMMHLHGDVESTFEGLSARIPPVGGTRLVDLEGIDDAVLARTGTESCLVMPHGGPRIRRLVTGLMEANGVQLVDASTVDAQTTWPEALDRVEATMLQALSMTESPRAIPLLLAQPRRHRSDGARPERGSPRQRTLDRLLVPPVVALAGVPNVGKSTLINRLAGRDVAITADLAGTTRDAVVARVVLDGLACEVVDLPGRREEGDEIERESIRLSERFIEEADLLVVVTDERDLNPEGLGRKPDLRVSNKADLRRGDPGDPGLGMSAMLGEGIEEFRIAVRRMLVPDEELDSEEPWLMQPASGGVPVQSPTME